jgi:hypothetical protein
MARCFGACMDRLILLRSAYCFFHDLLPHRIEHNDPTKDSTHPPWLAPLSLLCISPSLSRPLNLNTTSPVPAGVAWGAEPDSLPPSEALVMLALTPTPPANIGKREVEWKWANKRKNDKIEQHLSGFQHIMVVFKIRNIWKLGGTEEKKSAVVKSK